MCAILIYLLSYAVWFHATLLRIYELYRFLAGSRATRKSRPAGTLNSLSFTFYRNIA